jgi:hypothetical protein
VVLIVLWLILVVTCLVLSARYEGRHRLIADLPTSNTSGAFVGLVEINGRAECISPLRSHVIETVCVWYRWSVSKSWSRQETQTTTDSTVIPPRAR